MRISDRETVSIYRKRYGVSRLRQWWYGGKTVSGNFGLKPCPTCHGNDRIRELMEAPGFVIAFCDRCQSDYLA